MEMDCQFENGKEDFVPFILKPSEWLPKLVSVQADIIYNCIVILSTPIFSFFSVASDSYHRAEKTLTTVEMAVQEVPSKLTHGSSIMLKKICFGILGAIEAFMFLVFLLVLAAVLGVLFVQMLVEEPVFLRDRLFFDYTEANPHAIFPVTRKGKHQFGVPIGHVYHISLLLLMPESDFNLQIGVFQLTAEILSIEGNVMAKSSQPCMLRIRRLSVQQTRTFLMGIPLVLGMSDETQKLTIKILKHKEGYQKTGAIRVTLSPRKGTSSLPQLYKAEILLNSNLPWSKQLLHDWKWTFYVWASWNIYILLLMILIGCCKQVLFSLPADNFRDPEPGGIVRDLTLEELDKHKSWKEIQDSSGRRQLRRRKRKAKYLQQVVPTSENSASSSVSSSMNIGREETTTTIVEEVEDSESVCFVGGLVN